MSDVSQMTSPDGSSRGLLSEQLQSKMTPRTPPGSESVHPVSSSITITNKWMDRMEPYSQCRSRYAIENGMFYNGAGIRSVHSDLSDSDSLEVDGDSAEYLFREHFDDDLFDFGSDRNYNTSWNQKRSYSVEPASSSSSDGYNDDNDSDIDGEYMETLNSLNPEYEDSTSTESGHSDNDWLDYLGWNDSNSLDFMKFKNSSNFMISSNATNFSMNSESEFMVKSTESTVMNENEG